LEQLADRALVPRKYAAGNHLQIVVLPAQRGRAGGGKDVKPRTPVNWLDLIAVALMVVAVVFIASISSPFYKWLLLAAILSAIYGWATHQRDLVAAACLFPPLYLLGFWANYGITLATPHTIDDVLARMDHGAGIAVWHWCRTHPACRFVLMPVYYGLGVVMLVGITFTPRRKELVRAMLIGAIAGLICYYLFPAVGPIWVRTPGAIRNCMPSLHLTWALLLWIYSSKSLRIPMFLFALLTAAASMGLGEHYAIDLVAALPFTAAICVLARFPIERIWRRPFSSSETESGTGSISLTPDS